MPKPVTYGAAHFLATGTKVSNGCRDVPRMLNVLSAWTRGGGGKSCGCHTAIKETRENRAPKIQLEANFKRFLIVKLPLANAPRRTEQTGRAERAVNTIKQSRGREKPPKDKKMKKKISSQTEEKLQANARHVN